MGATCTTAGDVDEEYNQRQAMLADSSMMFQESTLTAHSIDQRIYIPLDYTPSPRFCKNQPSRTRSRLPNKDLSSCFSRTLRIDNTLSSNEILQLEREMKKEISRLRVESVLDLFHEEYALFRSKSERLRKLHRNNPNLATKRPSLPLDLFNLVPKRGADKRKNRLKIDVPRKSVPILVQRFRDLLRGDYTPCDTPASDIFIDMDTTRSRAGWETAGASTPTVNFSWANPSNCTIKTLRASDETPSIQINAPSPVFNKTRTWAEIDTILPDVVSPIASHRMITSPSDSQFPTCPMLSPIFSNKVTTFANEDQRRSLAIVKHLEQTFQAEAGSSSSGKSFGSYRSSIGSSNMSTPSVGGGALLSPTVLLSPSVGGQYLPSSSIEPTSTKNNKSNTRCEYPLENQLFIQTEKLKSWVASQPDTKELKNFIKDLEILNKKYDRT